MNCKQWAFGSRSVLADSLYGESGSNFIDVLYKLKLDACRGNSQQSCRLALPSEQTVRYNRWRKFERVFTQGKTETRYIP